MATGGGVWPFCVKKGLKIYRDVSRDCTVAEGEFTMDNMRVFMAYDAGELSADGDELAMVA